MVNCKLPSLPSNCSAFPEIVEIDAKKIVMIRNIIMVTKSDEELIIGIVILKNIIYAKLVFTSREEYKIAASKQNQEINFLII